MATTTYTGTVTDSSTPPQTFSATIVLTSVAPPLSMTITGTPLSAPTGTPRTVTEVATGGTPPYTYSLSPGGQPNNTTGIFTVTPP
jgi:large repetitive protein